MRQFLALSGAVAALGVAAAPLSLPGFEAKAQTSAPGGQGVADFYSTRSGRHLWFGGQGRQVDVLLEVLQSAQLDGLNPNRYRVGSLRRAVNAARSGDPRAMWRAETMLSEALTAYARDLRRPTAVGVIYVDPELRPAPPSPRALLEEAARAPSLERYVAELGWMHPLYGQIRYALMRGGATPSERQLLSINLERARELPSARGRLVLVNAAAQRLFMYENGQVVDSMRVVVGRPKHATPMMTALIRFTSLNPYWNVPSDLAAERVAPNVVKFGRKYLRDKGYQVLSDWGAKPKILDPGTVDWQAVADGREQVILRQLPGPGNSMGRMKFMFPNAQGIYLHDTPQKELLDEAARMFSGGCVRLEDAARLARWLYGRPLAPQGARPEQKVNLPQPVPVALTYLTALPSGSNIAVFDDIYGRDVQRLLKRRGRQVASRD